MTRHERDENNPQEAKKAALQRLEDQKSRWNDVIEVIRAMERLREENHFSAKIAETFWS